MTMALSYRITVNEHLDDSWSAWFDGLTITHAAGLAAAPLVAGARNGLCDFADRDCANLYRACRRRRPCVHHRRREQCRSTLRGGRRRSDYRPGMAACDWL